MFCIGPDPPQYLVFLSHLFDKVYPVALIAAVAALAVAVLCSRKRFLVLAVSFGALGLLLEPIAFLCIQIVPLITDFDSESGEAVLAFVMLVVLPVTLPVLALWLARRKRRRLSNEVAPSSNPI
jgi:hypothetical protein